MSTEVSLENDEKKKETDLVKESEENLTNAVVSNEVNLAVNHESIKAGLDKIDEEFEPQYPVFNEDNVYGENLSYKPLVTPTESEIEKIATDNLHEYKQSSISKLETNLQKDMTELDFKQEQAEKELESIENDLVADEKVGLEKINAENIGQGLARSSIAVNKAKAYRAQIDHEMESALEKANSEIAEISLKRSIAESEFQTALESFDIAYASKLEKKISELTKEYSKKQAEALDYNERIAKQREVAYNEWKAWADNFTEELNQKKGQKKAYYVVEQIKGMSKREALEFVNDAEIVSALGNWYNAVLDYVQRVLK
ncbi:MAG: hypothetical protein IJ301_01305 [Clostridia bacterium]|nr:hypothetical protein [Clostridia bacterium]